MGVYEVHIYHVYHKSVVVTSRAKTNILNVNEQIIFLKNEYSNILYIISISLIALNHKGTGRSS